MASEKRLIDANNLMEQVKHIHNAVNTSEINTDYDTGFHSATSQVQGLIAYMPTVDAVEIPDKKLIRAIKLLLKQYEHSKNSDYVHSPVAHAFFHTWKQLDAKKESQ